jgi:two-component system nitrogen regulation sensor histidine kinase NtrY
LPQAKPVVGSINATVNESIAIFRSSHVDVQFVFEPDESVPEFKFDPDQIKRVLVNLLDNAVSAVSLEPVKTVFVATKYDPELHILRLTVADTGVGIPPQMRARVFEPYFSTKSEGTGLGLAIVKRIIEDHSGFIRALGNDPKGTKMVIELPVNEVDAWKPTDRSDKKES